MITHSMLVLISALIILASNVTESHPSVGPEHRHRRLLGFDAWTTAPACQLRPAAASSTDSLGRRWGWEQQTSCAFKDEQQQPLSPQSDPALQEWSAVAACPEAPTSQNSAADTAGRLWGMWYGRSCAFKTPSGQPAYYDGYQGPKYSSPEPSPARVLALPQASPAVAPITRRPSPSPTQAPARASPRPRKSPSPKPSSQSPSPPLSKGKEPASAQTSVLPQPVLSMPLAASPRPAPSPPVKLATEVNDIKEPTSAQPGKLPQPVLSMPPQASPQPSTSLPNNTLLSTAPDKLSQPALNMPVPASPEPNTTSPNIVLPSPAPAADIGATVCECPATVQADLDVDKIATLVAEQLWQKLADASNSYEGVQVAEGDMSSLDTSAKVEQQQQEVVKLTNLLSAIEALSNQAVKRNMADPAGMIKAAEWASPEPRTASSAAVYVPPIKPLPALSIINHLVSIQNTTAARAMRRPGQVTDTALDEQQ